MNRARLGALLGLCAAVALCLSACSTDYSRSYNRALDTFASGEYAEAAEAFERLGDYAQAAGYAAYSRGLVLYEQGQYAEAEPYFAQSREILYGDERYQYCHAHVLAQEGRFAEAAEAFEAIGEFEDAPLRCQYCLGRDAEAGARYDEALFAYEAAITIDDAENRAGEQGWTSVCDPACGAGATLIAAANTLRRRQLNRQSDINYQKSVLFVGQDIDHVAAMMCYIQLSLLGCPGYICVGNTLTNPLTGHPLFPDRKEGQDIWFTPMFFSETWHFRRLFSALDAVTQNKK